METPTVTYEAHPYALLLPDMTEAEFAEHKADIAKHGLKRKIVLFNGMILDGRHRYRACMELGKDMSDAFEVFCEDEQAAFDYVVSENIKRRHLTTSQRADIAAQMSTLAPGRPSTEENSANLHGLQESADKMGVSRRLVATAKKVRKTSEPLADEVKNGNVTLNAADADAQAPKAKLEKALKEPAGEGVRKLAKHMNEQEAKKKATGHPGTPPHVHPPARDNTSAYVSEPAPAAAAPQRAIQFDAYTSRPVATTPNPVIKADACVSTSAKASVCPECLAELTSKNECPNCEKPAPASATQPQGEAEATKDDTDKEGEFEMVWAGVKEYERAVIRERITEVYEQAKKPLKGGKTLSAQGVVDDILEALK